jgi:hypothetical protein
MGGVAGLAAGPEDNVCDDFGRKRSAAELARLEAIDALLSISRLQNAWYLKADASKGRTLSLP